MSNFFLCDYTDAYILVAGDITVARGNLNTKVAFTNCHPFVKSEIHLNDEHVEESDNLDIIMNMYNLIEYSDNYSDSTASLYHYMTVSDSSSFRYKSDLLGQPTNIVVNNNNVEALESKSNLETCTNYCSAKICFIFL